MIPLDIIQFAFNDGVIIDLSSEGTLKLAGNQTAVSKWKSIVLANKPIILSLLKNRKQLFCIVESCCFDLNVDPQEVIDRLLSVDDEQDIINGQVATASLKLQIELWYAGGMPNKAGKLELHIYEVKTMLEKQVRSQEQEVTLTLAKNNLLEGTIRTSVAACNNIYHKDFDLEKAKKQNENDLIALQCEGGLQAMLAAQMMAIHKLQQTSMALANGLSFGETSKYYTNTAIKLSNTFIQQASLLAKLQGGVGQKIIVERVDVSHGGQAIIGNVNGGVPADKAKI